MDFLSHSPNFNQFVGLKATNGSFTVDGQGKVITSTLPKSFSKEAMVGLAAFILESIRGAQEIGISVNELKVEFQGLNVSARSLRSGVIVFLSQKSTWGM